MQERPKRTIFARHAFIVKVIISVLFHICTKCHVSQLNATQKKLETLLESVILRVQKAEVICFYKQLICKAEAEK